MRLAPPPHFFHTKNHHHHPISISETSTDGSNSTKSMSQGFHQIISFSNGFDRSRTAHQGELVAIEDEVPVELPEYETGGMWSDMFNFPPGASSATALLDNQIQSNYQLAAARPPSPAELNDWYGNRQHNINNRHNIAQNHQISSINADSAAAMQLFLMNPPPKSPSPPPPSSSLQGYHSVESQGLSLSLSSSLQQLKGAKAEELRMRDEVVFNFDQGGVGHHENQQVGFRSSLGMMSFLRNSKYVKAARELLEEFCSVNKGQFKNNRLGRHNSNPNPNYQGSAAGGGSSSSSKDLPPLSAADRIDYQRKKTKLFTMLDEVDRRYHHYCEQMQMVVNSFDSIMGLGSATPYTSLAQKAMSRHFRCLKDAISTQLKLTCEVLGEKDVGGASGVTKGETPRLKLLEQSLRQQRAFHQMGMMQQEVWRPQRGLPERSVNILRAWLFEHFLHPYPSDADKHLLARQTGLSRNQVSNWFINARVRLWKPMVEEMYQRESKEEEQEGDEEVEEFEEERESEGNQQQEEQSIVNSAQIPTPTTTTTAGPAKRSEINATDYDPSFKAINRQYFSENQARQAITSTPNTATTPPHHTVLPTPGTQHFPAAHGSEVHQLVMDDTCCISGSTLVRFGTTMGDVSLTLGLRHAGNLPEKNQFSIG